MKIEHDANMQWSEGTGLEHQFNISLQMKVDDLLKGKNIESELRQNPEALRKELFTIVSEQVLPKIIRDTKRPFALPQGTLNSESSTDWKNNLEVVPSPEHGITMFTRMELKTALKTSRPTSAIQALHAERGNITAAIVDALIHSLKNKYLGVKRSDTTTHARLYN